MDQIREPVPTPRDAPPETMDETLVGLPSFQPPDMLAVCNLVMKGGVTSGVVFPGTLRVLASAYRFRRIGGTSAGAIAASFAAAGEYARRQSGSAQAFDAIYALGKELSSKPPNGPYMTSLEALFAPNISTARVYRLVTALTRIENQRMAGNVPLTPDGTRNLSARKLRQTLMRPVRALASVHPWPSAVIAVGLLGAVGGTLGLLTAQPGAPRLALAGTWGLLAGLAWLGHAAGVDSLRRVRDNHYGLSKGFEYADPDSGVQGGAATQPLRFTAWLHAKLQSISGLGEVDALGTDGPGIPHVLTFGHLAPAAFRLPDDWALLYAPDGGQNEPPPEDLRELTFTQYREGQQRMAQDIDLRHVTTNISFGRPVTLPIDDTSTDAKHLYFRQDEWKEYFPEDVMEHLMRHSERMIAPEGQAYVYYRLPPPALLPVVVSTRLSMSFPGLFSPVPLHYGWWTEREDAARVIPGVSRKRLHSFGPFFLAEWDTQGSGHFYMESVVFGDGGLTSNFPLALFDDLSPTEPTFGLDLYYPKDDDQNLAILIPPSLLRQYGTGDAEQRARWNPGKNTVDSLLGYGLSIVESARNWSDNAMMGLPGFGERVVHIVISTGLGGTNLSMTPEQILMLRARGVAAGRLLLQRYLTGENVALTRTPGGPTVPWNWAIHSANHFIRLTADLERALQEYAGAYENLLTPEAETLILSKVRVQRGGRFNSAPDAPWRARAAALITLGLEVTTLRGYRKLRGRRGLLRYRSMH